ncbi:DUF1266 domain-containing protein [Paenibacillus sp. USDA918EY]|uniref:DUF1266 domain-containing protein n=2 Tax=Paenibacillus albilobatus TaxID=2716884 RepID=A0A920CC35_9BACL|nr:DUF1266 domain-containing protein [Paenibacillus sp. USDA918EY]GIO31554.1 hypothetical protein J2TS6_26950 [Paenibacillus albilobatus]
MKGDWFDMPMSFEEREKLQKYVDAMVSLVFAGDKANYYIMNPESAYSETKQKLASILNEFNIRDAAELKERIEWLIADGKRLDYKFIYYKLIQMTEEGRIQKIKSVSDRKEQRDLTIVNRYLRRLPAGGITAFDCSFAVHFCCIGHKLRWLSKDEHWNYVNKLVRLAQESYADWDEYCTGFIAGLELYSGDQSLNMKERKNRLMQLLNFSDSPMVKRKLH